MTEAGSRILNRRTTAIHKETGTKVSVDNHMIPTEAPTRSHLKQRDIALKSLSDKLGISIGKEGCLFKHEIYEVTG